MSRVIEADRNTHGKPRVSKPRLLGKPPDQRKKFVQHTEPIKPKPIKSGPFKVVTEAIHQRIETMVGILSPT
ncbi:unnamed protein product [Acanthoscelides obtectus]|uniref:Uncharacterized protein n=1 Tax=Acanthoscelides obtectus TaxID=200917 RepID=A0A9P0PPJ3_ACAOB|nr:unnamed protein product [Acanthoscelides obtectus]CAK1656852.1 hypothetical protein AOBTE_LOCUS19963 [Acanthoscelides obtectus]